MNSSTSADLPIRRRPRMMTHLPGRAEPASSRTSASIPSSRASSRRRPTKPAITAPQDYSHRYFFTRYYLDWKYSPVKRQPPARFPATRTPPVKGHPAAQSPSADPLSPSNATRPCIPRCRDVPISVRCDVTPRPTTRARRPAISALPRIHGHHPAAGDPDDRPVPARQVIHAEPGIPRPRLNSGQTPRSRSYRTTLTALTRHFTLPAPHPQGTTPPRQTAHRATGNRAAAKIPTKSPHHTRLTGPASTTRTSPRQDISPGQRTD